MTSTLEIMLTRLVAAARAFIITSGSYTFESQAKGKFPPTL